MKPEVQGAWWWLDLALLDRERVLRGWTRSELARRAHVDAGTLSDMFRGKRRPTLGTIQAVAVAVGLTLDRVLVFERSESRNRGAPRGVVDHESFCGLLMPAR